MAAYIALLRKESETSFGVDFPDFPGCISGGETAHEAFLEAHRALAMHVKGMNQDGEVIPAPSTITEVLSDPENLDAIPFLVNLQEERGRAVRLNITLEENLLREIDTAAAKEHLSRSGFLAEAAKQAVRKATRR